MSGRDKGRDGGIGLAMYGYVCLIRILLHDITFYLAVLRIVLGVTKGENAWVCAGFTSALYNISIQNGDFA